VVFVVEKNGGRRKIREDDRSSGHKLNIFFLKMDLNPSIILSIKMTHHHSVDGYYDGISSQKNSL